jgi:hypothetical protein
VERRDACGAGKQTIVFEKTYASMEVYMAGRMPSSDDIIFALETLGFDIEDEGEFAAVLSDGNYTVKINHNPTSDDERRIREELDEIFADYEDQIAELIDEESEDYDESVRRVAAWLKGPAG